VAEGAPLLRVYRVNSSIVGSNPTVSAIYKFEKQILLSKNMSMTNFKAEDFPLYQHLVDLGNPGVERAKADFEAACKGGEVEKYQFALGIQTIAANVPLDQIPGATEEMNAKTLRSCLDVFKVVAKGTTEAAANARIMVNDFDARGLGL
jgi:hypothetical protein